MNFILGYQRIVSINQKEEKKTSTGEITSVKQ